MAWIVGYFLRVVFHPVMLLAVSRVPVDIYGAMYLLLSFPKRANRVEPIARRI